MMNREEYETMEALIHELEEIVDWMKVENSPLREIELRSISAKIQLGKDTLA